MTLLITINEEYKLFPCYLCRKWKTYYCSNMCKNCNDKQQKFKKHILSPIIKCNCSEECNKWLHSLDIAGRKVYQIKGHYRKMEKNKGKYGMENHPMYKGGITIDKDGYELTLKPDHPYVSKTGYVREHRLVMEKYLGRYLTRKEVVHHKNRNKLDNRIENLELVENQSKHMSEKHLDDSILNRVCSNPDCRHKNNPYKQKKNGRPRWFNDGNGGYWCLSCYQRMSRLKYKP